MTRPRPRSYSEEDIAAEEERIGGRLPDELRRRFLDGVHEQVFLLDEDGDVIDTVNVWGPSITTTDKKGREYPTPGMAKETAEVRDPDPEFLPSDALVAWAVAADGSLAVALRDGTLGWWELGSEEIVSPVTVDWDPDPDRLAEW